MDTAVVELAARSLLAAPQPFATLAALEKLPASECRSVRAAVVAAVAQRPAEYPALLEALVGRGWVSRRGAQRVVAEVAPSLPPEHALQLQHATCAPTAIGHAGPAVRLRERFDVPAPLLCLGRPRGEDGQVLLGDVTGRVLALNLQTGAGEDALNLGFLKGVVSIAGPAGRGGVAVAAGLAGVADVAVLRPDAEGTWQVAAAPGAVQCALISRVALLPTGPTLDADGTSGNPVCAVARLDESPEISLLDLRSGRVTAALRGHRRLPTDVLGTGPETLLSCGADGRVLFFDARRGRKPTACFEIGGELTSADLAPDGHTLVTVAMRGDLKALDLRAGPTASALTQLRTPAAPGRVAVHRGGPEGLRVAVATSAGLLTSDLREVSAPEGGGCFDVCVHKEGFLAAGESLLATD